MKNTQSFYFLSCDLSSLNAQEVSFTSREVDILACLLHMRGTSKIASLLDISPNTVLTHTRNIMSKMNCNSREGIIDFVEKNLDTVLLNQHYIFLRIQKSFESSLKEIAKINRTIKKLTITIFGNDQHQKEILLRNLKSDLAKAGVTSTIKTGTLWEQAEYQPFHFFVFTKDENSEKNREKIVNMSQVLMLTKEDSYYSLVFEILKKVYPESNFENYIRELKEIYKRTILASSSTSIHSINKVGYNEDEPKNINKNLRKFFPPKLLSRKVIVGIFSLSIIVCVGIFWKGKLHFYNLESKAIRSDLVVPSEAFLLERPKLLNTIQEKLAGNRGIQTIVLVGIGGIGKTVLARQAAQLNNSNITWAITADTRENLRNSFEDLAASLANSEQDKRCFKEITKIENIDEKDKKIIQFVKDRLKSNANWFLIFDNIENFNDIKDYFPQDENTWGQGKVIITTRNRTVENSKLVNFVLPIEELTPEEMLSLFAKIITNGNEISFSEAQKAEALHFLKKIPPYPLDVTIAAYYLKATQAGYNKYLDNLFKESRDFEKIQQNLLAESGEYGKTRYGVISLSLKNLLKGHKEFAELLLFISLLDSQSIPIHLLEAFKSGPIVDDFIYNLKKYSLITKDGVPVGIHPTLSLHKSTQAITLNYLTNELALNKNNPLLDTIGIILDKFLLNSLEEENFFDLKVLANHCNAFLYHKDILPERIEGMIRASLGAIYYNLGNYEKAKVVLEASLPSLERPSDIKSNKLAWAFVYLGDTYREMGLYQKAKKTLEKSYAIYTTNPAKNPKEMGWVLTRLSNINRHLGYFEEAKLLLEKALTIYVTHCPDNQDKIAWIKTYLANLNKCLGNFEKAKIMLEESLRAYKHIHGDSSIRTAWAMTYLGDVYRELGDNKKAQSLLESGLVIYEKKYGKDNIENARILRNLGQTYLAQNQLERAESSLQRGHYVLEKRNHPDLYLSFESLSDLCLAKAIKAEKQGNQKQVKTLKAQAKDYLQKAQSVILNHFPSDTPLLKRIQEKNLKFQ